MDTEHVVEAFRMRGFAQINLPQDIDNKLLEMAHRFYAKPLGERLSTAAFHSSGILGYYPSEAEARTILDVYGISVPVFDGQRARGYCSYDFIANQRVLESTELFGANRWPADEGFQSEACALYESVSSLMKDVCQSVLGLLEARGKRTEGSGDLFGNSCCSIMRLLKYSKASVEAESKAHTDYEFISLIKADDQGLEVRSPSGAWEIVPCSIGKAVVIPGDMIEIFSGGWIQSAVHRVRFGAKDRLAAIFFQGLELEHEIGYALRGERVVSTFGKHLCGMLVRGAPHLRSALEAWETRLGGQIPEKNPFRSGKDG